MSFSSEVKRTIALLFPDSDSETNAELLGMIMYSKAVAENEIVFSTDVAEVSDVFSGLMLACFDCETVPLIINKNEDKCLYRTVLGEEESKRVFERYWPDEVLGINAEIVKGEKEKAAFVRGAFMSCGFVNPPEKSYSIEFRFDNADLAADFSSFMAGIFEMPKLTVRKTNQVAYYRNGNIVGDVLSYIGAKIEAFEVMNAQAYKSIRNEQNRQTNFEIANLSKQAASSVEQLEAIEWLIKNKKLSKLSSQLKMTARLRRDNPDLSLSELAKLELPPVSKSQESKRLKHLIELYKTMKSKQ